MGVLEGLKTATGQGYQLECNRCQAVSGVFTGRLEALRTGFKHGWEAEVDGSLICSDCTRRKTRYDVLRSGVEEGDGDDHEVR